MPPAYSANSEGRRSDQSRSSSRPRSLALEVFAQVELWAEKDLLKNHPVRALEVGDNWMISVLEGLQKLQKGEVNGEKLVVQIAA